MVRFLKSIILALRQLNPELGHNILEQLHLKAPSSLQDLHQIASSLTNSILKNLSEPFGLVLDDLHWINEPRVYQMLDFLLEHLPPQMRLIIATRYDPPLALARLRARGQLTELRLSDLKFNHREITTFLNDKLNLQLSESDLNLLQNRSEGWAAGVQMLASSLDRCVNLQDRAAFVARVVETDRYLFDYLVEEVLELQELKIRTFLLETSILTELTPEICEAVTGHSDAAAILSELYRRNLFMVALDERRHIYRYHDLFAEFLQEHLRQETPQMVAYLYKCAAHAQTAPAKAIRYFLAGELWEEALTEIIQAAPRTLEQGLLDSLHNWIETFPLEIQKSNPWLLYYKGTLANYQWRFSTAKNFFEQALSRFEKDGIATGLAETRLSLEKSNWYEQGNTYTNYYLLQQIFDGTTSLRTRIRTLILLALHDVMEGNWQAACIKADSLLESAAECNDPLIIIGLGNELATIFYGLPGAFARLIRLEEIVLAKITNKQDYWQIIGQAVRFLINLWEGRWKQSIQDIETYCDNSVVITNLPTRIIILEEMLPMFYALEKDYATARQLIEATIENLAQPEIQPFMTRWLAINLYWQGRILWEEGKLPQARQVLARLKAFEYHQEWAFEPLLRDLLNGLLLMTEKRYPEAKTAFLKALPVQNRISFTIQYNDVRILLAYLSLMEEKPTEALTELAVVLEEYRQEGRPGLLIWQGRKLIIPLLQLAVKQNLETEFATHVLELLGEPAQAAEAVGDHSLIQEIQPLRVAHTGEILTARELEVIKLLIARSSNREIAHQLIISEETVKAHVSNILRKLNITSRYEVAAYARKFNLI